MDGKKCHLSKEMKESDAEKAYEYAEGIINTVREPLIVLDGDLRVISASRSFYTIFKTKPKETEGKFIYEIGDGQWDIPELRQLLEKVLPGKNAFNDFEVEHEFPEIGKRTMLLNAREINGNKPKMILLAIEDVTEHKKNKVEAIIAREYAESIVETLREPLIVLDKDLKVVSANKSFYDTFKVNKNETKDVLIYNLGNGQWDIPELRKLFEELLPKKKVFNNFEVEHEFKEIGKKVMLLNARQLDHVPLILLAIEDITERREIEKSLEKSEVKYKELFENASDAIFIAETKTRKLIDCNKKAEKLVGYSKNELLFMHADDIHPEDKVKEAMENFKRQDEGKISLFFSEVLTKDKKRIPVSINAAKIYAGDKEYLQGIFRDITDQKMGEEKLKENTEKLNQAQQIGKIGNWELDVTSKKKIWSDETYRLYERDKSLGPPSVEEEAKYYSPEEGEMLREIAKKVITSGICSENYDLSPKLPSGKTAFFIASMSPIKNKEGKVIKLFGIIQDITERKKTEEKIKKQIEQLKELDSAKTDFLNTVSHELKTPLTAIYANLELLEEKKEEFSEKSVNNLSALRRNSNQLRFLIDNILEIARIQSNKFELNISEIDLGNCLKSLVNDMKILADRKNINLIIEMDEEIKITTDKIRLIEIVNNLIDNAIKFTDKGYVKIKASKQDYEVLVEIIDTGIGIPEDKQFKIFEKFYQVHNPLESEVGGTGLGLSITKQLVELLGGKINFKSVLGKGSTFYFTLPIKYVGGGEIKK